MCGDQSFWPPKMLQGRMESMSSRGNPEGPIIFGPT